MVKNFILTFDQFNVRKPEPFTIRMARLMNLHPIVTEKTKMYENVSNVHGLSASTEKI